MTKLYIRELTKIASTGRGRLAPAFAADDAQADHVVDYTAGEANTTAGANGEIGLS